MSTKINEMRLRKWLVALALTVCVFGLSQRAGAVCDLWSESSDVLSPIDGNDCVDANDFTATDDVEAAKFHTTGCTVSGTKSVAFGNGTTASGDYSAALGYLVKANKSGGFAIGSGLIEDGSATVTPEADGVGSVFLGGMVRSWQSNLIEGPFKAGNDGAISLGGDFCYDGSLEATGKGSITLGGSIFDQGDVKATGDGSLVAGFCEGPAIEATGTGSVAIGSNYVSWGNFQATNEGSVAIGCIKYPSSDNAIESSGKGSVVLGYAGAQDLKATGDGSVAIGNGVIADAANAFAIGKGFTNDEADSFAVGFGDMDFQVSEPNIVTVYGDLEVTGTTTPSSITEPNEREVFFQAGRTNTYGDFEVRGITGGGTYCLTGHVPYDFDSLTSLKAIFFVASGAAQSNRHFHLESDYGTDGEVYTNHEESDDTIYVDLTGYTDKIYGLDISSVVDAGDLAAGDLIGIEVNHQNLGGTLRYLGMLMQYKGNW